jgi:hypothetical protein
MDRLSAEWRRLYLPHEGTEAAAVIDPTRGAPGLIDPEGRTRALVLAVAAPPDWGRLSAVWQGVQTDLAWPAPAIAVSGTDGHQLWFSLAEAVPVAQAAAVLDGLRQRYLGDMAVARVRTAPVCDASDAAPADCPPSPARWVPALQAAGQWSAFVVAGLAPLFADEPWLDTPPSQDAQADLLSRLRSIAPAAFESALAQWQPAPPVVTAPDMPAPAAASVPAVPPAGEGVDRDPRRFLLDVMNDPTIALALRIEAAKALLPHA